MTTEKVIITGGTGLLGKALVEANPGRQVICTYIGDYAVPSTNLVSYKKLDVLDLDGYVDLFNNFRPDVVIHAASIGSPDYAEKNRENTWQVNVGGTKVIRELCERYQAKLIHISSNGVYDGEKAPYAEQDEAEPINYYGQTKLESEKVARQVSVPVAIVRPILMYGWPHACERGNIITFALSRLGKGETVNVYEDVCCNPLYALKCAEAIWKIIDEGKYGVYNIAGRDTVSIYELVKCVAEVFGYDTALVKPVRQGFFNELVRRPKDTSYDTGKMRRNLGLEPLGTRDGLVMMKNTRQRP